MTDSRFSISTTVKQFPTHPYEAIKDHTLGKRYTLSLSFVGSARAKNLNEQYRNKSYTPDILSFPLTPDTGEIFICTPKAHQTAPRYGHSPETHIAYLFIHGLLHLKGFSHGATMEKAERRICARFKIPISSDF